MSSAFCIWYFTHKHWLANNVLGLAFSVQGIEHLSLGAVTTGVILLSGLFFYDIFWVFCTPVMVRCQPACNCLHCYAQNHWSSADHRLLMCRTTPLVCSTT